MRLCCVWTYFRADTGNRAILTAPASRYCTQQPRNLLFHTHAGTNMRVLVHTGKKGEKSEANTHTELIFFFFFETFPSFLPVFAYRSDFYFWMNQRWARCWLLCCVTNPRQRRDNSLSTPPVSWRPTAEFRFNSGLFSPPLVYFLVSRTE